jgi:hypothetical protein
MKFGERFFRPPLLVAVLVVSTIGALILPMVASPFRHVVAVSDIAPSEGRAFIGRLSDPGLSDHESPTSSRLYLVELDRGSFLHALDRWCRPSYLCNWITALVDVNYPLATHEGRRELGPSNSAHADIFQKGEGRYSIWHGYVYFSLPAGSHIAKVKRLELEMSSAVQDYIEAGGNFLGLLRDISALALAAVVLWPQLRKTWFVRNVVPGLAVTTILLGGLAAAGELYLRHWQVYFPKTQITYSLAFHPDIGFTFKPGAQVKWTNGVDFWTVTKINSLGFADAEPVLPKPKDRFRVLLVGDSFVEAVQVPIQQKVQTLLAAQLNERIPARKSDVVALGMSGTGQSNELSFYERNRKDFAPDLVVLIFVGNDFANNSPLLEAVRNGWDPEHLPRLFMRPDCTRAPISADWAKFLLPAASPTDRVKLLRARSHEIDRGFGEWKEESEDMDQKFYKTGDLPPAFEEAISLTKCAFAEWKKLAAEDRFQLLVVAAEQVDQPNRPGQINRLKAMLEDLNIPLLNLRPEFLKRGDLRSASWQFDGHWNPTGHRWAAEAIVEYIMANHVVPHE